MPSDVRYVYVEDEYCRALGYTSGHAYEVIDRIMGGRVSYYRIKRGPNHETLIYTHWCYEIPKTKFEFPKELFEI